MNTMTSQTAEIVTPRIIHISIHEYWGWGGGFVHPQVGEDLVRNIVGGIASAGVSQEGGVSEHVHKEYHHWKGVGDGVLE